MTDELREDVVETKPTKGKESHVTETSGKSKEAKALEEATREWIFANLPLRDIDGEGFVGEVYDDTMHKFDNSECSAETMSRKIILLSIELSPSDETIPEHLRESVIKSLGEMVRAIPEEEANVVYDEYLQEHDPSEYNKEDEED